AEPGSTVEVKDQEGNSLGSVVADPESGAYEVELSRPVTDGETVDVTATDEAGNTSEKTPVTGEKDTVAPEAPTAEIDEEGLVVTGNAEPGSTVEVTDSNGEVIGSGTANEQGEYEITLDRPVTDGETVDVTATDEAGNTSESTPVTGEKDTVAPDAPDAEIGEDGLVVKGKAEPGSTVEVKDQEGNSLGSVVADPESGAYEVELSRPVTDGETVDVTATDEAGNTSEKTPVTGEKDTVVPDAPDAEIDDSNSVLTVKTEPNATVKVYDSEGKPLLDSAGKPIEFEADENGDASYTFEPALERGKIINVTATDKSGNESQPTEVIAGVEEILATVDNYVDVVLDATPKRIENENPEEKNKTGFSVVSAGLGPVLDLNLLGDVAKSSMHFEVGDGQVREITLQGQAGGVQVGATMNLYFYKLNESTGQWEQQMVEKNWLVSYLLGGKSEETTFELTEGKWMVLMAGNLGVQALTGYTLKLKKDIILDYGEAESVKGSATGNMITDEDPKYGMDEVPEGTTLTAIKGSNGEWLETSSNGEIVVEGLYGHLIVKADGSYHYEVNEDFRGYGEKDIFTYEVTSPSGKTSQSELTFELNITPREERIEFDNTVVLNTEPTITYDGKSDLKQVGFSVLDLPLAGSILSAEALSGAETLDFTVGVDEVKEMTFHGSAGGVAIGVGYDLHIYKLDPETGNYVQVHVEKSWFWAVLLGGKSDQLTLQFGEGEYKAFLQSKGGLGLLTGAGLYVDHEKVYDYGQPAKYSGSVTGDAVKDSETILLKVDDQVVEPGKATVVMGEYGKLVINSDGTYTYTVVKPKDAPEDWKPPYGAFDSFRLVTQDANGKTIVDSLNIKIGLHTADDDFNNIAITEENVKSEIKIEDTKAGKSDEVKVKNFTIEEGQIGKNFIIEVVGDSKGWINPDPMMISYVLKNLTTGQQWEKTTEKVADVILKDTLASLPAGDYELSVIPTDQGGIKKLDVNIEVVHLNEYEVDRIDPITGMLFENDKGKLMLDTLKIADKQLSVNDPKQGAESIEIEGLYGILVVNKDGSYTYTPKGGVYGIDRFIYETISKVGTKETATLEINVGKVVMASEYDDVARSSSADDSFTMGAGADTVIFKNLGDPEGRNNGNGANGFNKWADFNLEEGDKIDLVGLLDGNQTTDNIEQYLQYEDGILYVDRLGQGKFEALLEVEATDLDSLLEGIAWEVELPTMVNRSLDLSQVDSFMVDDIDEGQIDELSLPSLESLLISEDSGILELPELEEEKEENEPKKVKESEVVPITTIDPQTLIDPLDELLDPTKVII
ncbi:hypothetical protein B9T19_10090, partial [Ignatzschineria sp. F8392]|uniref:BapA/Bap/LapF family large adhesin n=1 Tax=Ignatzschineria sp. F8392 TaxID=1980117 RepID=UPI000BDA923F